MPALNGPQRRVAVGLGTAAGVPTHPRPGQCRADRVGVMGLCPPVPRCHLPSEPPAREQRGARPPPKGTRGQKPGPGGPPWGVSVRRSGACARGTPGAGRSCPGEPDTAPHEQVVGWGPSRCPEGARTGVPGPCRLPHRRRPVPAGAVRGHLPLRAQAAAELRAGAAAPARLYLGQDPRRGQREWARAPCHACRRPCTLSLPPACPSCPGCPEPAPAWRPVSRPGARSPPPGPGARRQPL